MSINDARNFHLYQTEDGRTRIRCRMEEESLWLTQARMAALFQTTPQNITRQVQGIHAEGEQDGSATCQHDLQVQNAGERSVSNLSGAPGL